MKRIQKHHTRFWHSASSFVQTMHRLLASRLRPLHICPSIGRIRSQPFRIIGRCHIAASFSTTRVFASADASTSQTTSNPTSSKSNADNPTDKANAAGSTPSGASETTDATKTETKRLWDLGFRGLWKEWKTIIRSANPRNTMREFIAGITVPMVSIPVALGSAVISGVPPHLALAAAVIGGTGAALFGGTRIAVTGPATGMAFALSPIIQSQGLDALIAASLCAGGLQIVSGMLGGGSIMRSVPLPVLWAFPTGVGAALFISQLSRAVELPPLTEMAHRISALLVDPTHPATSFLEAVNVVCHEFNASAGLMAAVSFAICTLVPRRFPRFPVPITTVAAFTLLHYGLQFPVMTLTIPEQFFDITVALPTIDLHDTHGLTLLIQNSILVFTLSSMQSLLTSRALEKIVSTRYDANQELIGQGISNVCCGLFGALPVTSLIVQSTMNYMSGAQTRMASIFAAGTIAASALVIYPFISYIPIPALIGSLLSVAYRMMSGGLKEISRLRAICTPSTAVYGISGVSVMAVGVTQGVLLGLSSAVSMEAIRSMLAQHFQFHYRISPFMLPPNTLPPQQPQSPPVIPPLMPTTPQSSIPDTTTILTAAHHSVVLSGSITFWSATKIAHLFEQLTSTAFVDSAAASAQSLGLLPPSPFGILPQKAAGRIPIVFNGKDIRRVDVTAAQQMMDLICECTNIKESKKTEAERTAEQAAGRWVVVLKKPEYSVWLLDWPTEVLAAMKHFDNYKLLDRIVIRSDQTRSSPPPTSSTTAASQDSAQIPSLPPPHTKA